MLRRFSPLLLVTQFFGDLVLTLVALKLAELARLHIATGWEQRDGFVAVQPYVFLLVLAIWPTFFLLFGVYDSQQRGSLVSELSTLWLSVTVAMLILASFFYFLAEQPPQAPSRLFYLYLYIIDLALLTMAHVAAYQTLTALRRRGRHLRRVLLVGGGIHGRHVAIRLRGRERAGLVLEGYLSEPGEAEVPGLRRLGGYDDLLGLVEAREIDEVVMALPAEAHLDALHMTTDLQATDANVRILPDVFEMAAMKARVEDFFGLPLISIREPSINPVQARVKRAFDLVLSAILLALCSPLMLAIALWIRLDSPGPVLIHQRRVGAGAEPFYMHKFRTMHWKPEDLDRGFAKQPHDPRVTRVGRLLRRTSLDELPQLWNVLRGEMSLVGPRPELPAIVELYEPWQRKRFAVPPGMTGWWQVNGRSERSMHLNTEIDLYYVQNYSILLDLQILVRTVGAVIRGKGAY
ncbi:MAG: sugar transferase [Chloroflexi bacterium]|nr:sugar transferase [Chloroflexota bacterium]